MTNAYGFIRVAVKEASDEKRAVNDTDLHLRQDFENLPRVSGRKYEADRVQCIRAVRQRDALGQLMKEGIGVAAPTVSVVSTVSLALMPFPLITFAPLGARLATVYDLATHRCLALKERIRVCEVDSEWPTANFVPIEVADGGECGSVV